MGRRRRVTARRRDRELLCGWQQRDQRLIVCVGCRRDKVCKGPWWHIREGDTVRDSRERGSVMPARYAICDFCNCNIVNKAKELTPCPFNTSN